MDRPPPTLSHGVESLHSRSLDLQLGRPRDSREFVFIGLEVDVVLRLGRLRGVSLVAT